jgi:hypothetical protein
LMETKDELTRTIYRLPTFPTGSSASKIVKDVELYFGTAVRKSMPQRNGCFRESM